MVNAGPRIMNQNSVNAMMPPIHSVELDTRCLLMDVLMIS